ncbi:hypothetical protein [Marivirga sp.]|uniref:hypothetical protein n=1 Tax=Marivirga sp. TaxID=2018662 RepID=UPI002D7F8527|nr:hypothetical protein [Marivirga sp.]HET8858767.1 hypothetical protein [Marivirga sp.]
MKRIKKEHITGFFIGLITVLTMELVVNTEKYVDAFKEGYNKARLSEIKNNS